MNTAFHPDHRHLITVQAPDTTVTMSNRIRVLIVDPHPICRLGLTRLLESTSGPEFQIVGSAATVDDAIRMIDEFVPNLVILEPKERGWTSTAILNHLRAHHLPVRTVLLTTLTEPAEIVPLVAAGACGYISKASDEAAILSGIRQVAAGYSHLPEMLLAAIFTPTSRADSVIDLLSAREKQVFSYLGDGLTSKQIARRMEIATSTVDSHRERIKKKLGFASGAELQRSAMSWRMQNAHTEEIPGNVAS